MVHHGRRVRARPRGRRDDPGEYRRRRARRLCLRRGQAAKPWSRSAASSCSCAASAQGPPAVVLHGGPGAHHDYLLPGFDALARRTRAHLLRPARRRPLAGGRATCRSAGPSRWPTSRRCGVHWSLERLTLVGYSWGGLLALLYALGTPAGSSGSRWCRPAPAWRAARDRFEARLRPAQPRSRRSRRRGARFGRAGSASGIPRPSSSASSSCRWPRTSSTPRAHASSRRSASPAGPSRRSGRAWATTTSGRGCPSCAASASLVLHGEEDPIPIEAARVAAAGLIGAEFHALPALRPRALRRGVRGLSEAGRRLPAERRGTSPPPASPSPLT